MCKKIKCFNIKGIVLFVVLLLLLLVLLTNDPNVFFSYSIKLKKKETDVVSTIIDIIIMITACVLQ